VHQTNLAIFIEKVLHRNLLSCK